jgi:hypothetical protein
MAVDARASHLANHDTALQQNITRIVHAAFALGYAFLDRGSAKPNPPKTKGRFRGLSFGDCLMPYKQLFGVVIGMVSERSESLTTALTTAVAAVPLTGPPGRRRNTNWLVEPVTGDTFTNTLPGVTW